MQRGLWILAIGLLALVLGVPASLRAAEGHGEGEGKTAHKNAGKGDTDEVEQDLFGKAVDLGIWTLAVFLLLLFVLSKFAWKPMMQGLEHRERAIHSALQEAQQAREEADRLRRQLEEQQRRANEQARQILDEARHAAERTTADMIAEAHKKIQAEHERLQREMSLAYDQAKRDLQTQVVQLSTLVASKVLRRQLDHDDYRRFTDEALAELHQVSNGRQQTALV
jgi:F-type H+-transporting ATPase subunit b